MATERRVTTSRIGRLTQLGRLATGLAGGAVSEGARQLMRGRTPSAGDLLLTPANARRLGDRLSEMRGAAMKVGQLLSMDGGHVLPPALTEMLARLREDAHSMPLGQLAPILEQAWGANWDRQFRRFSFTPAAAASIGQVHEATLKDGHRLAVKIQYPGIRESIDSDVDNVATLLRITGLVPEEIDFAPLLEEAKIRLHAEADYRQEALALTGFEQLLSEDHRFEVPTVEQTLTTPEVLSMSWLDGQPVETIADQQAARRDTAAAALVELAMREVFHWGIVQTDPNFANYLYQPATGRIQLLDFGAARRYAESERAALRALLAACTDGDDVDVANAAVAVGYLADEDQDLYTRDVVALLRTATEPVRQQGNYRFGGSDLPQRMKEILVEMRLRNRFGRLPPPGVLFLHRRLGGLYLLLARLRASISVSGIAREFVDTATGGSDRATTRLPNTVEETAA